MEPQADPQPQRARLILLDSHILFRESLARFLASQRDFDVMGECGTSSEAIEIMARMPIDVVLAEFDLGAEHGTPFIAAARQAGFRGGILMVTDIVDGRESAAALKLGASGIFLKSKSLDRLVHAIRLVAMGEI